MRNYEGPGKAGVNTQDKNAKRCLWPAAMEPKYRVGSKEGVSASYEKGRFAGLNVNSAMAASGKWGRIGRMVHIVRGPYGNGARQIRWEENFSSPYLFNSRTQTGTDPRRSVSHHDPWSPQFVEMLALQYRNAFLQNGRLPL